MLECHIVKDLLPNYIDGLLSTQTEQDVQQHLKDCCNCQSLYKQMQIPIEEDSFQIHNPEVDFLKKIKNKTLRIKMVAGILAAVLIVLSVFTWFFMIGTPISSENIAITTEIQTNNVDAYLGQEWVIHFNTTNGKALFPRCEYVMSTGADGNKIITGCIIKLNEVQAVSWMHESKNYTWGYSVSSENDIKDFTVTVKLKGKSVVYSMTEEGLFEPHRNF